MHKHMPHTLHTDITHTNTQHHTHTYKDLRETDFSWDRDVTYVRTRRKMKKDAQGLEGREKSKAGPSQCQDFLWQGCDNHQPGSRKPSKWPG